MRLLHTSDWHLGRNFGQIALLDDQARFCDWLVDTAIAEGVDLVVVAGDVYDRAVPPIDAIALFRGTVARLAAARIKVVAIAGNHDSPERLSAADGLTDAAGVFIRGGYARASDTITLDLADGSLDVVAVPYLDPLLAPVTDTSPPAEAADANRRSPRPPTVGNADGWPGAPHAATTVRPAPDRRNPLPGSAAAEPSPAPAPAERPTHQSVLAAALRAAPRRSARAVAVVHAFVAGGVESESERALSVGGADRITAGTLHDFSYVALGHLHTPQLLNRETRRYSGSPLAYSFSETTPKQVVVAELDGDGAARVTPIPVPVGRPVAVLQGTIAELLDAPEHTAVESHFVRAVLTDAEHVLDAKLRLQRRFPFVTEVVLAPPARQPVEVPRPQRLTLDPLDAALSFWIDVNGRPASGAERGEISAVMTEAAREVRRRNEAGLRA